MPGDILKRRKIAVLGSRSVGKSSLVLQYIENHFVESYYPTIEASFSKSINYNGVDYDCDIVDTAGQDEYSILNSKHAIGVHGFVLVYSVASRASLEICQIIYDKIVDYGFTNVPCVIVGSKTDLPSSGANRQVSFKDAQQVAESIKAKHIETSAKKNINVAKVFETCLQEIERLSPNHNAEPPSKTCLIQ
jgi:Ras family protein